MDGRALGVDTERAAAEIALDPVGPPGLRLIHAPHAAPYTTGFGMRRARRGRG
jgi:hypothetical protein